MIVVTIAIMNCHIQGKRLRDISIGICVDHFDKLQFVIIQSVNAFELHFYINYKEMDSLVFSPVSLMKNRPEINFSRQNVILKTIIRQFPNFFVKLHFWQF